MEKILITGGKGFLGSRFEKMWNQTYNVITLGSKEFDVTDESFVNEFIQKEKPQYIIHAAGIPNQQFCIDHPEKARAVNVDGALNVARACKKVGAKLIFFSTEQVFNGCKEPGPYREDSPTCPNTVYGENKLEVEKELSHILEEYWVVRLTWLFGLPEKNCKMGSNILWDTVQSLIRDEVIRTTEYEFRGMSDVDEICRQLPALFALPYGTYHFGSTNNDGRYEIVKYIMQELGVDEQRIEKLLIADNSKFSADHVRDLRLDTTKVRELGITFTPTKEAITRCLKQFSIIR